MQRPPRVPSQREDQSDRLDGGSRTLKITRRKGRPARCRQNRVIPQRPPLRCGIWRLCPSDRAAA
jgi:hypothetical protein